MASPQAHIDPDFGQAERGRDVRRGSRRGGAGGSSCCVARAGLEGGRRRGPASRSGELRARIEQVVDMAHRKAASVFPRPVGAADERVLAAARTGGPPSPAAAPSARWVRPVRTYRATEGWKDPGERHRRKEARRVPLPGARRQPGCRRRTRRRQGLAERRRDWTGSRPGRPPRHDWSGAMLRRSLAQPCCRSRRGARPISSARHPRHRGGRG